MHSEPHATKSVGSNRVLCVVLTSTRSVGFWLFFSCVGCYSDVNLHRLYLDNGPSICYNDTLSYCFERAKPELTRTIGVAIMDDSPPFRGGNTAPSNPSENSTW